MRITWETKKEPIKIRVSGMKPGLLVIWEGQIYLTAMVDGVMYAVNLSKGTYLSGSTFVTTAPLGTKVILEAEEKDEQ